MNDGLGSGVGEDDGTVVFDVGVDLRLDVEGDGADGLGELAVHDPGGEIDAVAAEVEERACTVLFGVGEPGEEGWADADLLGAFVAVVDDELAEVADLAFAEDGCGGGVGVVPGGFVVGEDGDVVLFGEALDGEGVFDGGGQGLFDHGGDVERGGLLDGGAVTGDGGVDEDGLGVGALEHRFFGGEEEVVGEVGACGVLLAQGRVGFGDADEGDLGMGGEGVEEAQDVVVVEADDGYADGGGGGLGGGVAGGGEEYSDEADGGEELRLQ